MDKGKQFDVQELLNIHYFKLLHKLFLHSHHNNNGWK